MRKHRLRHYWEPISLIASMLYNINRGKGKRPMKPDEFNPYAIRRSRHKVVDKETFFSALKAAFIGRG